MVGRRVEEFVVLVLLVVVLSSNSVIRVLRADDDQLTKDKQECAPQLSGLAPCLSYVQGNDDGGSKTPTADCCQALKTVLKTSKKCLCLLVKYRNDPSLGLKIDANRALGLPAVCHSPASITECPSLLHLAPNSPDAKVFDDFAKSANATSSPSSSSAAAPSSTKSTTIAPNDGGIRVRPLPLAIASAVLLFAFALAL